MRRRWVQIDGELVEVSLDHVTSRGAPADSVLWNDRLYQDGGDQRFTSRTQHREYMRANNLTTVDDFKETWRQNEKERIEWRQTGKDPSRKADMIEAIHKLQAR